RRLISDPLETDDDEDLSVLAQVGITTARDGTLTFTQAAFRTQPASRGTDGPRLCGGAPGGAGVADRISDYLTAVTQAGGLIDVHNTAVGNEIRSLEERISPGQRNLAPSEKNLRAQFVSLEVLVSSMESQGSFLLSALGRQS